MSEGRSDAKSARETTRVRPGHQGDLSGRGSAAEAVQHALASRGRWQSDDACCLLQGIGIDEILEAIVKRVPAPKDTRKDRLRALIFDSYYDAYKVNVVAGPQWQIPVGPATHCRFGNAQPHTPPAGSADSICLISVQTTDVMSYNSGAADLSKPWCGSCCNILA